MNDWNTDMPANTSPGVDGDILTGCSGETCRKEDVMELLNEQAAIEKALQL